MKVVSRVSSKSTLFAERLSVEVIQSRQTRWAKRAAYNRDFKKKLKCLVREQKFMRSLVREKYVPQKDDKIELKEEVYSLIYSFTH